jgi:hypothetical protein
MKNTKLHKVGDIVYVQQYLWPVGVARYTVGAVRTETGHPEVYSLHSTNGPDRNAWGYSVFDNVDDAFTYKYNEAFQRGTE